MSTFPRLIDSHCHLQFDLACLEFESPIISHAVICGVCPGDDWNRLTQIQSFHPESTRVQFGLHPWWIKHNLPHLSQISENLQHFLETYPQSGVGECGIDKSISKQTPLDQQEDILRIHWQAAFQHNRPITLHCVGSWGRLLSVLQELLISEPSAHLKELHSQTGVRAIILHSCNSLPSNLLFSFLNLPLTSSSHISSEESDSESELFPPIYFSLNSKYFRPSSTLSSTSLPSTPHSSPVDNSIEPLPPREAHMKEEMIFTQNSSEHESKIEVEVENVVDKGTKNRKGKHQLQKSKAELKPKAETKWEDQLKLIRSLPLSRILLESDSPSYSSSTLSESREMENIGEERETKSWDKLKVLDCCLKIAEIKGLDPKVVADMTNRNSKRVYWF